jgi:hypothetical protein
MYTDEIRGSDLQTQKPETYNCILQFNLNSPTTNVPFLNNIHFPLALSLAYNHIKCLKIPKGEISIRNRRMTENGQKKQTIIYEGKPVI